MFVKDKGRFAFAICLAMALVAPVVSKSSDQKEGSNSWIVSATIIRDGQQSGSGIYLKSGLIITAAHLTAVDAKMGVRIDSAALPAKVLKQGSLENVDLSLLSIDEEKLPASIKLPAMQLCEAPPGPGDPVIVVEAGRITRSHIVSSQLLPYTLRSKFPTLIADVATTGNSGSGVFDPHHKCLLGIMSLKITARTTEGKDKDIAKYFVPAAAIRNFMPAGFKTDSKRPLSAPRGAGSVQILSQCAGRPATSSRCKSDTMRE
jgi:S1-C subfamily serine protease